MSFYDELSRYYDLIFPMDKDTVDFLSKHLRDGSNVLDIACGTGDYSIELSKKGYYIDAFDLNEDMINNARVKSSGLNINFLVGDMTSLRNMFGRKTYDLIFCIGNSIVHLSDREEIMGVINDTFDMLSPNGELIIQIINFDRIINQGIKSLPFIEREGGTIKFYRRYEYLQEKNIINFNTELLINGNNSERSYKNTTPLIPIMRHEFYDILAGAGFKQVEFYGGFSEILYNEGSYAMVVRAIKEK